MLKSTADQSPQAHDAAVNTSSEFATELTNQRLQSSYEYTLYTNANLILQHPDNQSFLSITLIPIWQYTHTMIRL